MEEAMKQRNEKDNNNKIEGKGVLGKREEEVKKREGGKVGMEEDKDEERLKDGDAKRTERPEKGVGEIDGKEDNNNNGKEKDELKVHRGEEIHR